MEDDLKAVRELMVAKYGETLAAPIDGLLAVFCNHAADTRAAVGYKRLGQREYAAMYYGRVEATLETLAILGLPVPARSAAEVLAHAEALLANVPADELIG